jgi:hypothetical protein
VTAITVNPPGRPTGPTTGPEPSLRLGQGFLFGHPEPAATIARLLEDLPAETDPTMAVQPD